MTIQNEPYLEIAEERHRQDKKWGPPNTLPEDRTADRWLAILMEEVGELAEVVTELGAIREGWTEEEAENWRYAEAIWKPKLRKELIETAAVAVSWLEWLNAFDKRT